MEIVLRSSSVPVLTSSAKSSPRHALALPAWTVSRNRPQNTAIVHRGVHDELKYFSTRFKGELPHSFTQYYTVDEEHSTSEHRRLNEYVLYLCPFLF